MAKNTSILLGDYYDNYISSQIKSGRFTSASEVVRTALRHFEQEEKLKGELKEEPKAGEKSGVVQKIDRSKVIKNLHGKSVKDGL